LNGLVCINISELVVEVTLDPTTVMPNKRQRDSRDEDGQSRKKLHLELRKRYQELLTFAEAIVSGAKLDRGHITGILKDVTPNGSEISLTLRDDKSEKTIGCIFSEFTSKVDDFNLRIGKRVKVALTNPERVPTKGSYNKKYPFDLRFNQYCFTIGGQMFEDTKGRFAVSISLTKYLRETH
jgi:hypothetical protein